MTTIPERLNNNNFNFVLVNEEKKPFEKAWQNKIHRFNDPILIRHLESGKNYGVQSNGSSVIINGKTYFLIIVDFDKKEFQDLILPKFPETFTTTSGSPKNCVHLWFASDNNKAFKIKDENLNTLADIIGAGNQVISVGSKHPSGSIYSIVKDIPIAFMPYAEIEAILKPYDKTPKKPIKEKKQYSPKGINEDVTSKILSSVSMQDCLREAGIDISKNPTNCFAHSSVGGKCLGWNDETAHCFHCDNKWNKYSLIREAKNLNDKDTFTWFAEKSGMSEELKKSRKEFVEKNKKSTNTYSLFSRRGQIEEFWKHQPFFYDRSKIFYLWNDEFKKWEISDEVDFLNSIQEKLGAETIDSKEKGELITGFQQIGRKHKPKLVEKTWVQFKDKIYDVLNDKIYEASPEYFITNPIPWKVGKTEEIKEIDKLFSEWVGEEHKQELYEIIAYNAIPNKFMQRLFALCGGGSNGKGTFIKLNYRFLGKENCVSSEIKTLSENIFEPAVLYKKLLCVMGEVSYDDLKNTNMLKKLGGEDIISFQFKQKTPFSDENTSTCICLTNSLPTTPDKSLGFYRKWHIIDFPNQFNGIEQDLISKIPKEEFENLALKCLNILKNLYQTKKFTNEGTFEQRMERYEEHSNPLQKFIEEICEEESGEKIPLKDFSNKCNEYLKKKHLRILSIHQIGKILREEGFNIGSRKINDIPIKCILNLKLLPNVPKLLQSKIVLPIERIKDLSSFGTFGIFSQFSDQEIKESGYNSREELEKMAKGDKPLTEL